MAKRKRARDTSHAATDAAFERWFARRFGPDPDADDLPEPCGVAERTRHAEMLTRLFSESARLRRVEPDVAGRALWRIAEDDLRIVGDEALPWAPRRRCLEAVGTLFERYFERACAGTLGHLAKDRREPDTVCYMWWDVAPLSGGQARLHAGIIDVMERTLRLRSPTCQERALNGLGHWHPHDPARVEAIIDAFLASGRAKGPLADYARQARTGHVL